MASPAVAYARENQQRFLNELKDLLRIPSVSTTPEHKGDVQRAAEFVANELRRIGMENVEVTSIEEMKKYIGQETGVGGWVLITQEMVDKFADATGDHQFIHVDPERAKQTQLFEGNPKEAAAKLVEKLKFEARVI